MEQHLARPVLSSETLCRFDQLLFILFVFCCLVIVVNFSEWDTVLIFMFYIFFLQDLLWFDDSLAHTFPFMFSDYLDMWFSMVDTALQFDTYVFSHLQDDRNSSFPFLNDHFILCCLLFLFSFYYFAKCGLLMMEQHLARPVLSSETLVVLFSFYVFNLCFVAWCLLSDHQGWDTVIFL